MTRATGFTSLLLLSLAPPALAQVERARDVGFVATPAALVTGMLDLAGVDETDVVYDLGSGDGRIVIAAAQRGARGVGIELDSVLVEESRRRADSAGLGARATFHRADLFETDLRPATVVTLYLGRELNQRLRPIFLRRLRPGTRVVSQAFDMGDWPPDSMVTVRSREVAATPVHLWVVPADIAGRWSVTVGRERLELALTQRYQTVRGQAAQGDSILPLREVRLRGDSLEFSVGERRFAGRVAGHEAWGIAIAGSGPSRSWRAVFQDRR